MSERVSAPKVFALLAGKQVARRFAAQQLMPVLQMSGPYGKGGSRVFVRRHFIGKVEIGIGVGKVEVGSLCAGRHFVGAGSLVHVRLSSFTSSQ